MLSKKGYVKGKGYCQSSDSVCMENGIRYEWEKERQNAWRTKVVRVVSRRREGVGNERKETRYGGERMGRGHNMKP